MNMSPKTDIKVDLSHGRAESVSSLIYTWLMLCIIIDFILLSVGVIKYLIFHVLKKSFVSCYLFSTYWKQYFISTYQLFLKIVYLFSPEFHLRFLKKTAFCKKKKLNWGECKKCWRKCSRKLRKKSSEMRRHLLQTSLLKLRINKWTISKFTISLFSIFLSF